MSDSDPIIRRRARERALQFLFSLDFTQYDWEEVIEEFWESSPTKPAARRYAEKLIRGVIEKREALDAEIATGIEGWTPGRVGPVERAALRLALFEMRHCDDVPGRVAINESIEVVRRYGADDSPRFINAVLDRLLKKMEAEQVG